MSGLSSLCAETGINRVFGTNCELNDGNRRPSCSLLPPIGSSAPDSPKERQRLLKFGAIRCYQRLGGLLKHYTRKAARATYVAPFYDVNGDNNASSIDALLVINAINNGLGGVREKAAPSPPKSHPTPCQQPAIQACPTSTNPQQDRNCPESSRCWQLIPRSNGPSGRRRILTLVSKSGRSTVTALQTIVLQQPAQSWATSDFSLVSLLTRHQKSSKRVPTVFAIERDSNSANDCAASTYEIRKRENCFEEELARGGAQPRPSATRPKRSLSRLRRAPQHTTLKPRGAAQVGLGSNQPRPRLRLCGSWRRAVPGLISISCKIANASSSPSRRRASSRARPSVRVSSNR